MSVGSTDDTAYASGKEEQASDDAGVDMWYFSSDLCYCSLCAMILDEVLFVNMYSMFVISEPLKPSYIIISSSDQRNLRPKTIDTCATALSA